MAFSAAALQGVTLKKTVTREAPALIQNICSNEEQYQKLMQDTFMEKYFAAVEPFSFPSRFIALDRSAAQRLQELHVDFVKTKQEPASFPPELDALAEKISAVQAEANWPSVFVRLSIRSPKDAALSSASFDGHFAASLEAYKPLPDASQAAASGTQLTSDADQNLRLHALYAASMRALRSDSAHAVIATLVRSPRIQRDLADFCAGACATMNVVIREYVEFEPELEFRAFVCDGRVTALTQYCEFIYFPRLHARRAEVERVLCAFCDERVLPSMRVHQPELRSFVVDLILISSLSRAGVASDPYERLEGWAVEINPFAEFAGGGLFDFIADRHVLDGKAPFEFRVRTELPDKRALAGIGEDWQRLMQRPSVSASLTVP